MLISKSTDHPQIVHKALLKTTFEKSYSLEELKFVLVIKTNWYKWGKYRRGEPS